ncbi:MAG: hypothetical protein M3R70_08385 [Actinomycetota bacterium]|nr:hypothetical protein [Actinomycetota bacterium]
MNDDWRIRIRLPEEQAAGFRGRFGIELGTEAQELAKELEGRRLVVSYGEDDVFVYAGSRDEAERARAIGEAELRESGIDGEVGQVEQWLADEDRWSDEPPSADEVEAEVLRHGHAPWEVRIETGSRAEAEELSSRLEAEGYRVLRRANYVLVGAATEEEARKLAERLHGDVEASGELVYATVPQNPFAVFGGMGGSGTPL